MNSLEIADHFNIPLVINSYARGQVAMMHDAEKARELNPPPGLLERLAEEVDLDWDVIEEFKTTAVGSEEENV